MLHGRRRLVLAIAASVLVAAIAVTLTLVLSSSGGGEHRALAGGFKKATLSVRGHAGGEADREENDHPGGRDKGEERDKSPAIEAVASRAYPRKYVDDRRVKSERRAFDRLPRTAPRSAFHTRRNFTLARKAAPESWAALGPITPNVAGEDSQFFDPITQTGPPTQESGRVTALAIDPACAPGNCKLWVAAAGGGIWRTNDAMAAHPTWIAPPDTLPTNAFGSLY